MKKFTIGKVAQASNVSVETIRFYEKKGLIQQPTAFAGKYRIYPIEVVARIGFIQQARQLGFNLDEVGELLSLGEQSTADQQVERDTANQFLESVNQKIYSLARMQSALADFIEQSRARNHSVTCSIIDTFADDAEQ